MQDKSIVLLVGPKGAGKSTLGSALAASVGLAFLRVEPIYLGAMRAHPGLAGAQLEPIGFGAILRAVDELARTQSVICLESTGTAGYFPEFLRRLRATYRVFLVRVGAPPDVCVQRVQARDRADHIPVSDERVREINRVAEAVRLDWDLEIDNSVPGAIADHLATIGNFLRSRDRVSQPAAR